MTPPELAPSDTRREEFGLVRVGAFVGLENYEWLWDDSVFWLSVFNTCLYTAVASVSGLTAAGSFMLVW